MNIESKIRLKAWILYIVVAIVATATLVYFYQVREDIKSSKGEIEHQNQILTLTNELIYTVAQVQSSANLYVSTKNHRYIDNFRSGNTRIESLIDTLVRMQSIDNDKLGQINKLLSQQFQNLYQLNTQFSRENPVVAISEKIRTFEPPKREDTLFVTQTRYDTVVSKPKKRKFFQRIGDVFKPKRDSTIIVINKHVDTITVGKRDSLPIINQMDEMAREAGKRYQKNIQDIQTQVSKLIANDVAISAQLSGILLELHHNTIDATLEAIYRREGEIERNFVLSIMGGVVALIVILLFVVMIVADINQGQQARRELEKAHRLTRELMHSRHRLLLSISHDIKSPLSSIMGYLDLKDDITNHVPAMKNSASHIQALLGNLLEFSSLEQGTLRATKNAFNLHTLAREVYEMFLPAAMSKLLSFDFEAQNITVSGDRMKIKQIVINLVSNAVKYTTQGQIHFTITHSQDNIEIRVKDTGTGIAADKISELYKPFVRVESNSALAEGSGLGMFVVKGLVDLLKGTITVNSLLGAGTEVQVALPALELENQSTKQTKRIVIFDDDPAVETVAAAMLRKLGHVIVEEEYELILTDLDMGDVTGFDVLESAGTIPVIAMSGRGNYTSKDATDQGFTAFIAKPFTIEDMRSVFGEGCETDDFDSGQVSRIFAENTKCNLESLHQSLLTEDFNRAQSLCHKMLPMCVHLDYPTEELRRMDAARAREYSGWQRDVEQIVEQLERLF